MYTIRLTCKVQETEKRRLYLIGIYIGILHVVVSLDGPQVLNLIAMIMGAPHEMDVPVAEINSPLLFSRGKKLIALNEDFLKLTKVSKLEKPHGHHTH